MFQGLENKFWIRGFWNDYSAVQVYQRKFGNILFASGQERVYIYTHISIHISRALLLPSGYPLLLPRHSTTIDVISIELQKMLINSDVRITRCRIGLVWGVKVIFTSVTSIVCGREAWAQTPNWPRCPIAYREHCRSWKGLKLSQYERARFDSRPASLRNYVSPFQALTALFWLVLSCWMSGVRKKGRKGDGVLQWNQALEEEVVFLPSLFFAFLRKGSRS